ncbi:MAG TPA: serine hydrolase domain-containing protein [Gemmatimonadales bacterium]|nr:serine hydrolase domain-containing protein [Gemmatimonadales bacterium]
MAHMRFIGHELIAALFMALPPACAVAAAPPSAGVFESAAAQTVDGHATGAILVASHGRILWTGSVGDAKKGIPPPSPDAVFDALSIGKTFTAIAVQRLVFTGKIDLEASIGRYIPELPKQLDSITVQNCLDNASGWGPYLNDKGDFDPESTAQLIEDLAKAERKGRVGEYSYSNTGFQALGLVVQRVTGKPFKEAMRDLVFRPAKLLSTDFLGLPPLRERPTVIGWRDGRGTGSARTWPSSWSLMGAAGIAATVDDLFRLNRTFIAGDGLGAAGRARMLADGVPTGGRAPYREPGRTMISYGSGLYHWRDAQGRRVHFHGGDGDYGFHAAMFWREDDDLFIVGLFNSGGPAGDFDRAAFMNAFAEAAKQVTR